MRKKRRKLRRMWERWRCCRCCMYCVYCMHVCYCYWYYLYYIKGCLLYFLFWEKKQLPIWGAQHDAMTSVSKLDVLKKIEVMKIWTHEIRVWKNNILNNRLTMTNVVDLARRRIEKNMNWSSDNIMLKWLLLCWTLHWKNAFVVVVLFFLLCHINYEW